MWIGKGKREVHDMRISEDATAIKSIDFRSGKECGWMILSHIPDGVQSVQWVSLEGKSYSCHRALERLRDWKFHPLLKVGSKAGVLHGGTEKKISLKIS